MRWPFSRIRVAADKPRAADDQLRCFAGGRAFDCVGKAAAKIRQALLRHGDEWVDLNLWVGEITEDVHWVLTCLDVILEFEHHQI